MNADLVPDYFVVSPAGEFILIPRALVVEFEPDGPSDEEFWLSIPLALGGRKIRLDGRERVWWPAPEAEQPQRGGAR